MAAHQRRLALVERLPGLAVRSVEGLEDEPSWALRQALAEVVPREVAASLGTSAAAEALALRERLYRRAPAEVLAELEGQDTARAWVLHERALGQGRYVTRWPAAVLAYLEGLPLLERAEALVRYALTVAPQSLAVLRQAWRIRAAEAERSAAAESPQGLRLQWFGA